MININKIRQKIIKSGFQNISVSLKNGGVLLEGELDVYEDIVFVGKLAIFIYKKLEFYFRMFL